ncbi:SIR2 family protein [Pseudomonas chlororaphis subsp. aureofaciens]|uniref:SIR2 family protein n=1 Tax=Pseudomonas chlororaphis TaxID=587753 RepID=UPI0009B84BE7|nr:SIR2 family protein [Pseudomonas chlororaphis]
MLDRDLVDAYKSGNLILFIGAGVSKNLDIADWQELINQIANELGYDPEVFATYGDYLALAEFYLVKNNNKIGRLRSWMDRNWHSDNINIAESKIHEYIATGNFPLIYTTNYDKWIENSLQHHRKLHTVIRGVTDLANIDSSHTQIVKLHGDLEDDSSIVLGESSYFERLEFESPLDIKLRSDTLGKSVLFIGYSLNDINIRLLFYKLSKIWKQQGSSASRPKSYVFSHRPNPIQSTILADRGMTMITANGENPGIALENLLRELVESKKQPPPL